MHNSIEIEKSIFSVKQDVKLLDKYVEDLAREGGMTELPLQE